MFKLLNLIFLTLYFFTIIFYSKQESCEITTKDKCLLPQNNQNKSVFALILARGGSKGIPRKNLQILQNISLLGRTIEKIQETNLFSQIWVSTDDEQIADEARKYSAFVHIRPLYVATDTTSSLDSVKEFLENHKSIDFLALFQCTSIFLRRSYIFEAYEKFQDSECVFSLTESDKLRWKITLTKNDKDFYEPINFNLKKRPRRQDFQKKEFYENGMFYFSDRRLIFSENSFQSKFCNVVVIPKSDELEIDTPEDLDLARCLLHQRE